jgi:hypothetical protein
VPLSRRRMLAASLAAAAPLLAACGEPKLVELPAEFQGATDLPVEPPPTPVITNSAPDTAPRGPISVNLGVATGSPAAARLESLVHGAVGDATAANGDLDLNVVQIAVDQGLQFRNDPAGLIAAVESALGERGALDLLIVATRGDLLWLQAEGLVQPLDRFFSANSGSIEDYYPAGRQLVAFDGRTWALPLALVPTVLWYGEQQFLTAGGDLLYRRVLLHSHVGEQPFTRSGGRVPADADTELIVRAHMNNRSYGPALRGSPATGFTPADLPAGFASGVETLPPLPESCAG